MSLVGKITALVQAVGADIKSLSGRSVPAGGTTGQVLAKSSNQDYVTGWVTPAAAVTGNTYTVVETKTSDGIKAAHDAALVGGPPLLLMGGYDCSDPSKTILLQKNITIEGRNAFLDGSSTNHNLVKINNSNGLKLKGFGMKSTEGGSGYALLLINEEADTNDLTLEDLWFTCPNGDYNAITAQAWSGDANNGAGAGCFNKNWKIRNCRGYDLNRMFLEFHAHKWDGVARYTNLTVTGCQTDNSGLNSDHGMGISFSGDIDTVKCYDNTILNHRGHGIEFIGTRRFDGHNNTMISSKRWGGSGSDYGSNGYNLTDGYNAESPAHKLGLGARNGSINGGMIDVSGRPVQINVAYDISFTGGKWIGGDASLLQHGRRLSFTGVHAKSGKNFLYYADDTNDSTWSGGVLDNTGAVDPYEWIGFYSGSTGNQVNGVTLIGMSVNDKRIFSAGGGNKWSNVLWNGKLITSEPLTDIQVNTYADLDAIGVVPVITTVMVMADEKRKDNFCVYKLYPSGKRLFILSLEDN